MGRYLISSFLGLYLLSACTWFRKEAVVITSHGTEFGERYFSARLVEKLKNVDGTSIKDTSVLQILKEALTEELILEGALFAWARAHNIKFSEEELVQHLRSQVGGEATLQSSLQEARPTMDLLRDAIYIQLIRDKVRAELVEKIIVDDETLKKYLEEIRKDLERPLFRYRQVVLAEEHEAITILQHLREKKITFEDAEKKFSLIRGFRATEDLPWVDPKDSSFLGHFASAPIGLQSKVYPTPVGFHVVNILQVKKNANQPFAALRPLVETSYKQKKGEELYLQWLKDQVKTGNISVDQARLMSLVAEYQESF
ncbi:MAG: hypothetical protein IT287_04805 [Bdellovibrionaceae bacterium]|nr:hypothetical protein [Pseudobdellovibrionaceae bacterium]